MLLKKETKKAQGYIWAYDHSSCSSIDKAYKSCSCAKRDAFRRIVHEMIESSGFDMRITGKSSNFFSCAYRVYETNPDTGEITNEYIIYHTYCNTYKILYKQYR